MVEIMQDHTMATILNRIQEHISGPGARSRLLEGDEADAGEWEEGEL